MAHAKEAFRMLKDGLRMVYKGSKVLDVVKVRWMIIDLIPSSIRAGRILVIAI